MGTLIKHLVRLAGKRLPVRLDEVGNHGEKDHEHPTSKTRTHNLAPDELAAMYPSTEKERNRVPSAVVSTFERSSYTGATASLAGAAHSYPFPMKDPFTPRTPPNAPMPHDVDSSDHDPIRMPGLSGSPEDEDVKRMHRPNLSASKEMLDLIVSDERIQELWSHTEDLETQAIMDLSSDQVDINSNLENLQAARNYLLAGRHHYDQAEALASEVEARLLYKQRVRRWSYTWGLLILVYNVVWLLALALSASRIHTLVSQNWYVYGVGIRSLLITALTGSLGGVTGALYSLWIHVAKNQDFDRQHLMWYLTNPLMGGVLGLFVFLVYEAGATALSLGPIAAVKSTLLLYTIAWLSGFQQNVAYHIVYRTIKAVLRLGGVAFGTRRQASTTRS